MLEKRLLGISFCLMFAIAIIHISALQHDWYFVYRWLDFLVHMLGGMWIVTTTFWIVLKTEHTSERSTEAEHVLLMILAVLIISIGWELFEIWIGSTSLTATHYWFDTASDLIADCLGGVLAYTIILLMQRRLISLK